MVPSFTQIRSLQIIIYLSIPFDPFSIFSNSRMMKLSKSVSSKNYNVARSSFGWIDRNALCTTSSFDCRQLSANAIHDGTFISFNDFRYICYTRFRKIWVYSISKKIPRRLSGCTSCNYKEKSGENVEKKFENLKKRLLFHYCSVFLISWN